MPRSSLAVIGAVACSVSYAVRREVPGRCAVGQRRRDSGIWFAFALLVTLIAADNLLWRLAGWITSHAFVGVTGDLRGELFRHLTGHAPSYFAQRLAGTLTGRITATSNAAFAVGESFHLERAAALRWRRSCAIAYLAIVSVPMAAALTAIAAVVMLLLFRLAARGTPLHHGFAETRGQGRRRAGRRDRQHAAGPHLRRYRVASTAGSTARSAAR